MYCEGMFGKPANKIGPEGSVVGVAPRVDCAHLNIVNMYFSHVKKYGFTKKKKLDRPIVCSWPLSGSKSSAGRSLVVAASPSQVQFCCKHRQVYRFTGSSTSKLWTFKSVGELDKIIPSWKITSCSDSEEPLQPERIGELPHWKAMFSGCPAAAPTALEVAASLLAPVKGITNI